MTVQPHVLHIVDDATPGGVTRVLEHIRSCPMMAQSARHSVQVVSRRGALPTCKADMIVSHLSLSWRRLPALIAFRARHAGTPLVHVEHSYTERFTAINVRSKLRFFTMLRTAYAMFDTVVAVSEGQGAWLKARRLVSEASLEVIPPVVDLGRFRALAAPTGKPRVIGAIGRLHRQKGFDVLIEAFRALPDHDIALHIHGTGPEEETLRALAAHDPRILFLGHTDRAEAAMERIDVVAMPSRWEAYGLVALEARAAARPVVCAGIDGLWMSAGPDARFVQGSGVTAWTAALAKALADEAPAAPDAPAAPAARAQTVEQDFAVAWRRLVHKATGQPERATRAEIEELLRAA